MGKEKKLEIRGEYIYENGSQTAHIDRERGTVTFYCGDSYYDIGLTLEELEIAIKALKRRKNETAR